jgi:hypothetical protein
VYLCIHVHLGLFSKLPPYTLAGFDLTTHSSAIIDVTTRPRRDVQMRKNHVRDCCYVRGVCKFNQALNETSQNYQSLAFQANTLHPGGIRSHDPMLHSKRWPGYLSKSLWVIICCSVKIGLMLLRINIAILLGK